MRFGFHISITGGFSKVGERARQKGCQTIQLFSRNPRGWQYTDLDQKEVLAFKKDVQNLGLSPVFVHMPYLPNLASGEKDLFRKSVASLIEDLKRCEILAIPYLIMHVGKRLQTSEDLALKNVATGINQAFAKVSNRVKLLLENTAGMGSEIGYNFAQLQAIIDMVEDKNRIGVVLDTAHTFEAGYDIATKEGLDKTLKEFDKFVGLKRLFLLHLNDSKTELGSHIDRHWHIGEGKIGKDGFRNIINHPLLKHLPGIMETPRTDDKEDLKNMKTIKSLVAK
uniref:Probable endonuclease 4 n=1 Tax=candidate division WOR-3 bacterium TaxID=2052148 RepID=A0A7C6AAB4_UNCW3